MVYIIFEKKKKYAPLNKTVAGLSADTKMYEWDHVTLFKLATNLPKYKIVMNCLEIVLENPHRFTQILENSTVSFSNEINDYGLWYKRIILIIYNSIWTDGLLNLNYTVTAVNRFSQTT